MKTNKNNLEGINFQNDFNKVIELSKQDSFINSVKDLIINSYDNSESAKLIFWNRFTGQLFLKKSKDFDLYSNFPIISYQDHSLINSARLLNLYEVSEGGMLTIEEIKNNPEKFVRVLKRKIQTKLSRDFKEYFEYKSNPTKIANALPKYFESQWSKGFGYPLDLIDEDHLNTVFWVYVSPLNGLKSSSFFNAYNRQLLSINVVGNAKMEVPNLLFDNDLKLKEIHLPYKNLIFEKLFEFYNAITSSDFKELILNYFEANFELLPETIKESVCSKELNAVGLTNQYLTNLKESLFVSYRDTQEIKDKNFDPIEFSKSLGDDILKKVEEIILNFFKENQMKPANYTHTRISNSILELLKKNGIEMTQCFENYWELHYQLKESSKVIYSPFNSNLDLIRSSQYDPELIKKVEEELKNSNSTTTKQIKEDIEAILKMKTLYLPEDIVNHLRFVLSMPISF
jgi:hypothetical protein